MSDFGAGACDFHSDYASDFPGDFGGAPRTAKHSPEPPRDRTTGAGRPRQSNRGTRAAASAPRKRQVSERGGNATP